VSGLKYLLHHISVHGVYINGSGIQLHVRFSAVARRAFVAANWIGRRGGFGGLLIALDICG